MQRSHPEPCMVLIAERDKSVRELQQYFLGQAGFTVEFVDDGAAALHHATNHPPALIITEILIPTLDGLALCRKLREDPTTRDIPVIVFSILAAAPRAEEAGATAFLRKPLVESIFVAKVRELISAQAHESRRSDGSRDHG